MSYFLTLMCILVKISLKLEIHVQFYTGNTDCIFLIRRYKHFCFCKHKLLPWTKAILPSQWPAQPGVCSLRSVLHCRRSDGVLPFWPHGRFAASTPLPAPCLLAYRKISFEMVLLTLIIGIMRSSDGFYLTAKKRQIHQIMRMRVMITDLMLIHHGSGKFGPFVF